MTTNAREKKMNQQEDDESLSEIYLKSRNYFYEKSQLLFSLKQNYMKRLETFKVQKDKNKENYKDYVNDVTELALKDAELRFQRQVLLNNEIQWNNHFVGQLAEIERKRIVLQDHLDLYRTNRMQITSLQQKIHTITEQNRMNTLNSIVFMNYSKSILENEMRKSYLANRLFQQRKEMLKLSKFYNSLLTQKRKELRSFQINKINVFRRYERILLGKGKEYIEHQQQMALNNSFDFLSLSGGFGSEAELGSGDPNDPDNCRMDSGLGGSSDSQSINTSVGSRNNNNNNNNNQKRGSVAPNNNKNGVTRRSLLKTSFSLPSAYGPAGGQPGGSGGDQNNSNSLMYQMMNTSLDDEDEDDDKHINDTLEGRVANKILVVDLPDLFPQLQNNTSGTINNNTNTNIHNNNNINNNNGNPLAGGSSQTDDDHEPGGLPGLHHHHHSNHRNKKELTPLNSRNRRRSIVQEGDFIQFVDRSNKTSRSTNNNNEKEKEKSGTRKGSPSRSSVGAGGSIVQEKSSILSFPDYPTMNKNNKKKKKKTNPSNPNSGGTGGNTVVIYDPQEFVESCSGDYLPGSVLLELNNKGIGEKEEKLVKLVENCCQAKGKVRQLIAIKDGLNRELMKQIVVLLSVFNDLVGGGKKTTTNPNNPMKQYTNYHHNNNNNNCNDNEGRETGDQSLGANMQTLKDIVGLLQQSPHHQVSEVELSSHFLYLFVRTHCCTCLFFV
jgi:hypothetical protein